MALHQFLVEHDAAIVLDTANNPRFLNAEVFRSYLILAKRHDEALERMEQLEKQAQARYRSKVDSLRAVFIGGN